VSDTPHRKDPASVQLAEGRLATRLHGWFQYSLGSGHEISARAIKHLNSDPGEIHVVAPPDADIANQEPRESIGLGQDTADAALLPFVLALPRAWTVLVEDELAGRTDRALERELAEDGRWAHVSFIGDHPVWWRAVDGRAVELMRLGSAGYPRNAFLLSKTTEALGLRDGETLDDHCVASIAASVQAVVVGVYDDESYVVWQR
jgi:hypothetical protein